MPNHSKGRKRDSKGDDTMGDEVTGDWIKASSGRRIRHGQDRRRGVIPAQSNLSQSLSALVD